MSSQRLALDRESVRSIDADGHLHVERTPISMAAVNPYWGREIPDGERLGLDPERVYRLYRHPDELARAAGSFEGKPLLIQHKPVNAEDHPKEITVGAIGSPVNFDAPYLTAPLTVWDGEAIKLIESKEQRELSSSYRYRADMTPGTTPEGEPYDGVMRDIGGNHLALVTAGRAGPTVFVHDSAIFPPPTEKDQMATKSQKARAAKVAAFRTALDGKLAQDANIDEVIKTLMAQDDMEPRGEDEDPDEEGEGKKPAKDKEACDEDDPDAEDEEDEDDDDKKDKVSKSAMDAAIRSATAETEKRMRQQARDLRVAEQEVRPVVGEIAVACDSAEDVYLHALKALKVDITDVPRSAYRALFKAVPAQRPTAPSPVAMDAAAEKDFSARFPNNNRLK